MNANPARTVPAAHEAIVRATKKMYPSADIRVRRQRVIAVEGDLIRWIRYENLDVA
jgi:hypothetical protein